MTNKQQEMIEYTIQEVVRYLIEDESVSMEQAMERFHRLYLQLTIRMRRMSWKQEKQIRRMRPGMKMTRFRRKWKRFMNK